MRKKDDLKFRRFRKAADVGVRVSGKKEKGGRK